jgi:hypothetical protein
MSLFTRAASFGGSLVVGLGLLAFGSGDFGPAAVQSAPLTQAQLQQQHKKHHHKKHHKHHHHGNRQNNRSGQLSQQERQELLRAEALINRALAGR